MPTLIILLAFLGGLSTVSIQEGFRKSLWETQNQGEGISKSARSSAVRVTTDQRTYRHGEPILVTIRNDLSTVIYAPPGQPDCSVVSVQRLEADQWMREGSCTAGGPASFIAMASKSELTGALGPVAQDAGPQGPIIGEPSVPSVFTDDLRALPPVEPWKPGDPIREVPEGGIMPEGEALPFSALDGELGPGTYRIAFRFRVGSTADRIRTVYSEEFAVID